MPHYCCAAGCKNNSENTKFISFFSFPKDPMRCDQWKRRVNDPHINLFTPVECHNKLRLCSAHFENSMFGGMTKSRLKISAIPTIFSEREVSTNIEEHAVKYQENANIQNIETAMAGNESIDVATLSINMESNACSSTIQTERGTQDTQTLETSMETENASLVSTEIPCTAGFSPTADKTFPRTSSSAEICKAKWNILRGGYRRALRNRESGYTNANRKWRFEDDMSFLKECLADRRRHSRPNRSTKENTVSDNEEEFTIVKEEPTQMIFENFSDAVPDDEWTSSCGSGPVGEEEILKILPHREIPSTSETKHPFDLLSTVDGDSVRQFFLSLAETVKTLPPLVQAQVKAEVFKAVNTAELKYLQEKSKCTSK